ncbi:MAG: polyhydroxyalkanoate synthesis regulator DNA-binding domain-containing protein [Myxococcaceae bacterium]
MSELDSAAQPPSGDKEAKVIKRYTNRKLYDTVESRYVTLDEIAEMVKQGVEVQIVDNRTKDDLTSVTLAQIIFEEEKKKNRMPLTVLREIIRHPGESISGFIQKEVSPRVASIREEAEQRIDKLLGRADGSPEGGPPGAPGSPDFLKASQAVLTDWQKKVDERVKLVVENVVGGLPALGRDMQTLLQRLETLEKKIDELEKK